MRGERERRYPRDGWEKGKDVIPEMTALLTQEHINPHQSPHNSPEEFQRLNLVAPALFFKKLAQKQPWEGSHPPPKKNNILTRAHTPRQDGSLAKR